MTNTLKITLTSALTVSLLGTIILFIVHRTETLNSAYETYEQCVMTQLHTTPSSFYIEHGYYPECY